MSVRVDYIKLAEGIAALYGLPIPLEKILDDEGITFFCDDYGRDSFDGLTIYEPEQDSFYIHLNKTRGNNISNSRGRFTLAHELGHYFIDHHRLAIMSGNMEPHWHRYEPFKKDANWLIEREADNFASSLLMPANLILEDLRAHPFSGEYVHSLAGKYMVSFSAMAIRCYNLDFTPMMLVYAEDGKVNWLLHSDDFPFWRLKYGNYRLPENSVIGSYFYSKDVDSCRKNEIVFAGECFHVADTAAANMELLEYCIPYKNKAFSMFWLK